MLLAVMLHINIESLENYLHTLVNVVVFSVVMPRSVAARGIR